MKKRQWRWIFLESYNEILERMLLTYEQESGFRPENESDIMLRMRVLAGEILREHAYAEYMMRQMFPTTASGEYLEAHAAQRGLSRKNPTYAAGRVIFSAASEEHGDILIPAGTVVCTVKDQRRFVTDEDAVLPAGEQTVGADVTAAESGSAYNALPQTVRVIVTPVPGIGGVANAVRFNGGTDAESDDELRARVADSYRNISNGTNAAYYRSVAMSVDGVYSASVVGSARGAGTVNVYVCAKTAPVLSSKVQEIQSLLDKARELNTDVKVFNASPLGIDLYIRLRVAEGYDFAQTAEEVKTAVEEYINGLGIGHDVLLSNVGEVIYHVKGVAGYKFLETYGSDCTVAADRYTVADHILVREV